MRLASNARIVIRKTLLKDASPCSFFFFYRLFYLSFSFFFFFFFFCFFFFFFFFFVGRVSWAKIIISDDGTIVRTIQTIQFLRKFDTLNRKIKLLSRYRTFAKTIRIFESPLLQYLIARPLYNMYYRDSFTLSNSLHSFFLHIASSIFDSFLFFFFYFNAKIYPQRSS